MKASRIKHTSHTKQLKKRLIRLVVIFFLIGVMFVSDNTFLVLGSFFAIFYLSGTGSGSTTDSDDMFDDNYNIIHDIAIDPLNIYGTYDIKDNNK